jgi:hypothetical protein
MKYASVCNLLIKMFATSNDIERLSKPLRSRLTEFYLPEYNFDEFREIVVTW